MKTTLIEIKPPKNMIVPSSWTKKKLADVHLDAMKHCEFKCEYCSSNAGLHLKFQKWTLDQSVRQVTGEAFDPHQSANNAIIYENVAEKLQSELSNTSRSKGKGKTLVYSQLTDGFSPHLVRSGVTKKVLDLLLERTQYRIRVLTKNAIVGNRTWIRYFQRHADRFVVGLSIGTPNGKIAERLERRTSTPQARLKALRALQDAGVPTFGMLCPVLPDVLAEKQLEPLIDGIRPHLCEHVWAEPYNERHNWQHVRAVYDDLSPTADWFDQVFGHRRQDLWSRYATDLYVQLRQHAEAEGWLDKLRYLLYEQQITEEDAGHFSDLQGVLLQCPTAQDGYSRHPAFAAFQQVGRN